MKKKFTTATGAVFFFIIYIFFIFVFFGVIALKKDIL